MTKTYFIPTTDKGKLVWLNNFNLKLIAYATILGILAPALLIVSNDNKAFAYMVAFKTAVKKFAKATTLFLKKLSTALPETALAAYPIFPGAGVVPTAVPVGIFPRIAILVRQLKANTDCTDAMKEDLGITGTDIDPAFATAKPDLTMIITGGFPKGKYKRAQTNGIHVEEKRGTATAFAYLLTANKPTFIDTRPNLVPGQAEIRQYRAWFIVNDVVVGVVSNIVTISVG